MSLPRIASRDEWLAARKELLAKEKDLTKRRDALNAERRELPMVEVDKDYKFDGPDGAVEPARPVRGPPAADHLPLHVPPGVGGRLPELHRRRRRGVAGLPRAPAHPRHHLRPRVARAAREARALEGEAGLGSCPGTPRGDGDFNYDFGVTIDASPRLRRVQLPHARRVRRHGRGEHEDRRAALRHARPELLPPGRRPRVPHVLRSTPAASSRTGGSYYFLDLTALGRQEDWEEPKGRSESARRATPDFAS